MDTLHSCLPQLQRLFATTFSDVQFTLSNWPARLGALACAHGNQIHLRPDILSASPSRCLALLAHELAHVIQFRQGRLPAAHCVLHHPALEHEANLASHAALQPDLSSPALDFLRRSRPLLTSRDCPVLCRPDLVTNTWFNGKTRPDWAGNVVIHFEDLLYFTRTITRPTNVYGIIAPGSTAGRGQAPEPICGWRVSTAQNVPKRFKYDPETGLNARNTGIIDAEKGHIMALELGGPDIPENIVPQWAKWQGAGEWRNLERELEKEAVKTMKTKDRFLMFHCIIHYFAGFQNVRLTSERKLCVPVGFSISAPVMERRSDGTFVVASLGSTRSLYQQRDHTDDMIALRAMEGVEQEGGEEFTMAEAYDDVTGRKRKGKVALAFAKTGQDARYGPPPVQFRPVLTDYQQTVGNQFVFNAANANTTPPRRILKAKRNAAASS